MLWQHLNANGLVSDSQWGFCPSRSTVTALLSTLHAIFQLLEKGSDMCLIFWNVRVYAPSNMYCMQSGLRYLQMRHLHDCKSEPAMEPGQMQPVRTPQVASQIPKLPALPLACSSRRVDTCSRLTSHFLCRRGLAE